MEAEAKAGAVAAKMSRPRRRYSSTEKVRFLEEAEQPGNSISLVARKHGIAGSALFRWRQLRESGGMTGIKAGEPVVPQSEADELRAQVKRLQQLLGEKAEDLAVLKDAVALMREKKLLSPAALLKLEDIL